jgi:ABC-type lipoprotein export system ATPase subunit
MSETQLLLSAKNLSKTYRLGKRSLPVLQQVSLDVERGAFIALQGSSGAGKSTFLHLLGGLDKPDTGSIEVDGQNLATLSNSGLSRFRNERIGFIFQAYHLLPEFDALENVCIPARMSRHSVSETIQRARELLRRVGLAERMDHRPYELSGGEQQRVAIARALINEPELILADEPTGNLDSHTGEEILHLLCEIREERGATLLIATHDSKVASRAPVVIRLSDGTIDSSAS